MAIPAYTFSASFMAEVNRLEEYFDSKLLSSRIGDDFKSVSIDLPSFYNSKYLIALRDRYLKVGWKSVDEGGDRNERWLNFTLP